MIVGAGIIGVAIGVIHPIAKMTRVMKRLADGEMNDDVPALTRDDEVGAILHAAGDSTIRGPLNLTAPGPVTNREFTQALARALHRPAIAPAPAFALRFLLGEMADAMILNGRRVLPAKAEMKGFEFRYPDLDSALRQIYQ